MAKLIIRKTDGKGLTQNEEYLFYKVIDLEAQLEALSKPKRSIFNSLAKENVPLIEDEEDNPKLSLFKRIKRWFGRE